jgi:hypothetical protein
MVINIFKYQIIIHKQPPLELCVYGGRVTSIYSVNPLSEQDRERIYEHGEVDPHKTILPSKLLSDYWKLCLRKDQKHFRYHNNIQQIGGYRASTRGGT